MLFCLGPLCVTDKFYNKFIFNAYSTSFQNILEHGLKCGRTLFRSDDYDVTTCAAVTDVDFDGQKEIVLGTFGQELLVYKLIEKIEEVKIKVGPSEQIEKEEPKEETEEERKEDSRVAESNETETQTEKIEHKTGEQAYTINNNYNNQFLGRLKTKGRRH